MKYEKFNPLVGITDNYEPSNSGFGQKYKKGVKLVDLGK